MSAENYTIYAAERAGAIVYIGITGRAMQRRVREHLCTKRGCKALTAAIRKYGRDDFKWVVLVSGLSKAVAEQLERFSIGFYAPRYNIAPGGMASNGEAKARAVICINTERWFRSGIDAAQALGLSQMTISNLCRMGGTTRSGLRFRFADAAEVIPKPRPRAEVDAGRVSRVEKLKARRYPPQTIERMRVAAKLRGISPITRAIGDAMKKKPIQCIETTTIFPDAREAALAHGLTRNTVYSLIAKGGVSRLAGVSFRHAPIL